MIYNLYKLYVIYICNVLIYADFLPGIFVQIAKGNMLSRTYMLYILFIIFSFYPHWLRLISLCFAFIFSLQHNNIIIQAFSGIIYNWPIIIYICYISFLYIMAINISTKRSIYAILRLVGIF